ncbi:prostaglandin E2 receptor EP1 subtype [Pelobates fuscus]|uniref:prostaglandin E2 receptor EP1 subtype n=1 Tax=Pelobates fuscus TaxID=191477 RepID=UPI002FE4C5C0
MFPPLHANSSLPSVLSPLPPTSPTFSPTSSYPRSSPSPLLPSLSMAFGASSNALGLWILARAYSHSRRLRRSRAQFLLLASGLLMTDLAGHVIAGSFVLWLYSQGRIPALGCQFLGGCMVFFGLSPLLLGFLMACERCLGLTKPLWHSFMVTQTRARLSLALVWAVAFLVAILPLMGYGVYGLQPSRTWCFLQGPPSFCLLFSGLGLSSLTAALVCNALVGVTLLKARLLKASGEERRRRRRGARSHDLEMMVQLLAITLVSCVCWSPLLVSVVMQHTGISLPNSGWLLFAVRLASCNQILDPWVYILLRRSMFHRLCTIFVRLAHTHGGKLSRWDPGDFQSSDRSEVSRL